MFSPRDRTLSDSMDYDDELAELHDKRQRELIRLPNPKYVPAISTTEQHQQAPLVLLHPHPHPHPHLLQTADSDEDTEDASEDGDFRTPPFHGGMGGGGRSGGVFGVDGDGGGDGVPLLGSGGGYFGGNSHNPHLMTAPPMTATSSATLNSGGNIDNNNEGETEENERRLKEQAYFDKLNLIKVQLEELDAQKHVQFIEGVNRLKMDRKNRLETNMVWHDYEMSCIERDYSNEQKLIGREFEDKKIELRESLISELEEKRKQIEMDRYSTELTSDPTEVKQMNTRKLRRRPNDPAPLPERRKKAPQFQVTFLLSDREIEDDWKSIQSIMLSGGEASGGGGPSSSKGKKSEGYSRKVSSVEMDYSSESSHSDSRIEDGKLFYEKRWFHRGQPVFVEGQGMPKAGGVICSISQDLVWVRKVNDTTKIRVPITALQKGRLFIKRRAN